MYSHQPAAASEGLGQLKVGTVTASPTGILRHGVMAGSQGVSCFFVFFLVSLHLILICLSIPLQISILLHLVWKRMSPDLCGPKSTSAPAAAMKQGAQSSPHRRASARQVRKQPGSPLSFFVLILIFF